jgi:hypothetical protein
MTRRAGFVMTARDGKVDGFYIEEGTPLSETILAMQEFGIDPDVIDALGGSSDAAKFRAPRLTQDGGLILAAGTPSLIAKAAIATHFARRMHKSLESAIASRVAAARHEIRHPETGRFHSAVLPGIPSPGIWKHGGASLLRRRPPQ